MTEEEFDECAILAKLANKSLYVKIHWFSEREITNIYEIRPDSTVYYKNAIGQYLESNQLSLSDIRNVCVNGKAEKQIAKRFYVYELVEFLNTETPNVE